jgi:hypothetical protein
LSAAKSKPFTAVRLNESAEAFDAKDRQAVRRDSMP